MNNMNSVLLTDAYKLGHQSQYPEGTSLVFSNFTPRANKYAPQAVKDLDGVVVFGVQLAIKKIVEHFNENFFLTKEREKIVTDSGVGFTDTMNKGLLEQLKYEVFKPLKAQLSRFFGSDYDTTHFEKLWDLGYLPLEIRALEEGTLCPIKVPMLTIYNTLPEFYWLPNFLETILSQFLWKPMTSATIALAYKKILTKWADKTNPEAIEFVNWQGHDFSMRGLDSVEATIASGLGHLTSFYGTDSMPTVWGATHYYKDDNVLMGSVPATEHSVMCAGSKDDEIGTFRRLLQTYPNGILSVVSDTWDLWKVLTEYLPTLKDEIMGRDGKLVIRPDSGDPADILCGVEIRYFETMSELKEVVEDEMWNYFAENCDSDGYISEDMLYASVDGKYYDVTAYAEIGKMHDMNDNDHYVLDGVDLKITEVELKPSQKGVIQLLWDVFGGTVNKQGYKVLDSHIGAIYGDSITPERAEDICKRLSENGFASTNVVFGIGSYTYQYNTRDTFGFAMKATYVEKTYNTGQFAGNADVTEGFEIFKDPVTDDGLKKSAKGILKVIEKDSVLTLVDQINWDDFKVDDNMLKIVFLDGFFQNEISFGQIRNNVNKLI